ncbi:MAG: adenosylcobalamin-dependent ribonucleoside-diphosphate reductase [Gammaproteobacteria bacterium]|nr:adenosylcobalamin-dependent ribonucleoside-diphosphate reductase [Gammaproteobacteria bacterium]
MDEYFRNEVSRRVWDSKYRFRESETVHDRDVVATWQRTARALAGAEREPARWARAFFDSLEGFHFLPGGRILAGAGTGRQVTLFNCFVMGTLQDSLDGIFDGLKEGALTMQQGGGVGYDFSTLRPSGACADASATIASGPVSFMDVWDSMCGTLLSTGARRGAMMATLRCDHPDIEQFIDAKRQPGRLRRFNLSVLVSDAFMQAVESDDLWPLVFPVAGVKGEGPIVMRDWSGQAEPVPCRVMRTVPARELWERIMRATFDYAEPGVLFIDRINATNNLWYRERISATNPCGEIPLPPYGACDLGSLNLPTFVREPFTPDARLDEEALAAAVTTAVRLMDDVIEVSRFPLEKQAEQARGSRRIGLGITGLADALVMLGLRYDRDAGRAFAASVMQRVCHSAYRASVALAGEKGPFPFFERDAYLEGGFIRQLPADIRDGIAQHGMRNSHVTAIAPTGTISLFANNVSSGLEPIFDYAYTRRLVERDGTYSEQTVEDYAHALWRTLHDGAVLPEAFITAQAIAPEDHLAMQAALQPFVDNAISKTINVPADYPFETFQRLYRMAYDSGLKGCTTFRPNPITGAILTRGTAVEPATQCCGLEREGD